MAKYYDRNISAFILGKANFDISLEILRDISIFSDILSLINKR